MKHPLLFLAVISSFLVQTVIAQSGRVKETNTAAVATDGSQAIAAPNANETRTPAQLYDDANTYVQKKFAELEKAKQPYDQQLEQKIKQEQRELATRHAATVAARKPEGKDVYYLGVLHNLAGNHEGALEAMRRFLLENPNVEGVYGSEHIISGRGCSGRGYGTSARIENGKPSASALRL